MNRSLRALKAAEASAATPISSELADSSSRGALFATISVLAGLCAFLPSTSTQTACLIVLSLILVPSAAPRSSGVQFSPWLVLLGIWLLGQIFWAGDSPAQIALNLLPTFAAVTAGASLAIMDSKGRGYAYFAIAGSVICALCIGWALIKPENAITSDFYEQGSLNGLYVHRNIMGLVAGVSFVLVVAVAIEKHIRARSAIVFAVFPFVALVWAQSRTAWIAALFALFVMFFVRTSSSTHGQGVRRFLTFLIAFSVCLACLVVDSLFQVALVALGRDATFTGRTDIWESVSEELRTIYLTGIGWRVPWQYGEDTTERIWSSIGFQSGHAHNSYLDLVLQIGIVGLLLFLLLIGGVLMRSLRRASAASEGTARITLVLVAVIAIPSFTESIYHLGFVAFLVGYWAVTRSNVSADQCKTPQSFGSYKKRPKLP